MHALSQHHPEQASSGQMSITDTLLRKGTYQKTQGGHYAPDYLNGPRRSPGLKNSLKGSIQFVLGTAAQGIKFIVETCETEWIECHLVKLQIQKVSYQPGQ